MYYYIFFIIYSFLLQVKVLCGDSRRLKRIIGGDNIPDLDRAKSPLKSLQYYVWIGRAWLCHEDDFWWRRWFSWISAAYVVEDRLLAIGLRRLCPLQRPENLLCGGALIAPRIVQTACHCTTTMEVTNRTLWGSYRVLTNFEELMYLYMGRSDVTGFYYPMKSHKFAAHPKCSMLQVPPLYIKYDIGWVTLESPVGDSDGVSKGYWGPLDYANPYRMADLEKFHQKVVEQRHVCLIMGFGKKQPNGLTKTTTLKFGWIQIYDFIHCFDVLWKSRGFDQYIPYSDAVSWVCTQPLHNPWNKPWLGAQHMTGDSGSPISCSNNYFALVSSFAEFTRLRAGFWNISHDAAIYYAPEANTVEHRRDFEGTILTGRYNPENLRSFKYPVESIPYPNIEVFGKVIVGTPRMKSAVLPRSSADRIIQSRLLVISLSCLVTWGKVWMSSLKPSGACDS